MSKPLRRKVGIIATALAATAVAGAVMAPAASANVPNVPYVGQTSLYGPVLDNDNDVVVAVGKLNSTNVANHIARYRLHSADTWEKKVEVTDPSGKVIGTLITRDGLHDAGFLSVPESMYNRGFSLVFSKQKTFSVDRKFQVPLVNYSSGNPNTNNQNNHPVGYDVTLDWRTW
jgi:hypothetical protein